jgi:hypothetical protein
MNFEELQSTWAAQPAVNISAINPIEVQRVILPEIKRRRRMLGYGLFMVVLSLVIVPLLTVANYRYAPPTLPGWYWFYHGSWMVVLVAWLVAIVRSIERQGALRQQCTRSLRDLTLASLAGTEAEMKGYRKALLVVPLMIGFQLVNLYLKFAAGVPDWQPFGLRAALVVGLPVAIGAVMWRHYRVNLIPARDRQEAQLRELS